MPLELGMDMDSLWYPGHTGPSEPHCVAALWLHHQLPRGGQARAARVASALPTRVPAQQSRPLSPTSTHQLPLSRQQRHRANAAPRAVMSLCAHPAHKYALQSEEEEGELGPSAGWLGILPAGMPEREDARAALT